MTREDDDGTSPIRHEHHHHQREQPTAFSGAELPYVYAVGVIEPRFSGIALEKEFVQATAAFEGLTDQQALHRVLHERNLRYIARQLCWVHVIDGSDAYVLLPQDPADLDLLIESVREVPSPLDVDVVVGVNGGPAPAHSCSGLQVPIAFFSQVYSFGRPELISAVPLPEGWGPDEDEQFRNAAAELFTRVTGVPGNVGGTPRHRALNYVVLRYPAIYAAVADAYRRGLSLTGVDAFDAVATGARMIVEVVLTFTSRRIGSREQYGIRVDVTEEFPFVRRALTPVFDYARQDV